MRAMTRVGLALMLVQGIGSASVHAQDIERGRGLYEARCTGCHAVEAHRIGPLHRGVFGRRAGSAPGYTYSEALGRSAIVWNAATLDAWLASPERLVPGQKMGFSVADPQDRRDLIAYLRTLGPATR